MKMCTCGHVFSAHKEYGYIGRPNGPSTNKACKLCDCWRPVEAKINGKD